jgi:hypothetical protein
MIKILKKETLYFIAILVVLALLQHPDLLTTPFARFTQIINDGNYFHPFLWTFLIYFIIGILRGVVKFILFIKKKSCEIN